MTRYTYTAPSGRTYNREGSKIWAIPLILIGLALLALFWLLLFAIALGAANAWIMEDTFSEAWHAVWHRWPISLAWGFLFGGFIRWTRS